MRKLLLIFVGIFLFSSVSAEWTSTAFNNGLGIENLTSTNNQSFIRYLAVPSSVSYLMNGYLNLSGYQSLGWVNLTSSLTDNSVSITLNPTNNLIYSGSTRYGNSPEAVFSVYNATSNTWTYLNNTDTADWAGSGNITDIAICNKNGLVYTGSKDGKFGVYNATSNVWTDLSATDDGNWWGATDIMTMTADQRDCMIYVGSYSSGCLAKYNSTANNFTYFKDTFTTCHMATTPLDMEVDEFNNLLYVVDESSSREIIYVNLTNSSYTTINIPSISTQVTSVGINPNSHLVYWGDYLGRFGYYNLTSNNVTTISSYSQGNRMKKIIVNPTNNLVYLGIFLSNNARNLWVYNETSGIYQNISYLFNLNQRVAGLALAPNNRSVYVSGGLDNFGSDNKFLGQYDTLMYPHSPSLTIGSSNAWNYTGNYYGEFNQTNNRTSSLVSYINSYLSTCSIVSGYCNVPFTFSSSSGGILQYSSLYFNNSGLIENSQTYSNSTYESMNENFAINVTYDATYYTGSATLVYNGTSYVGTKVGTGNTVLFTASIITPSVSADTNFSFYWTITLSDGTTTTSFTSISHNQTVLNLSIDDCTTNPIVLYNFTVYDEETLTTYPYINGSFQLDLSLSTYGTHNEFLSYVKTYNSTSQKRVCINKNLTQPVRVDLVGDYMATDHVEEFYYIDNGTLTNATIPVIKGLYDLLTTDSTTFLFTFQDENSLYPANAVVHLMRKYVGEGIYREVETGKTDNNGETLLHLVEEDVIYQFIITKDDQVIYTSDEYTAKCLSTPCSIALSAITSGGGSIPEGEWDNLPEGTYSVSTNKLTRVVTLLFNLNESALMNISVFNLNGTGENFLVGNSLTASGGSVSVTVPVTYGNQTFFYVVYKNNGFVDSSWIDLTNDASAYFGTMGLFLGFLALLCVVLIGISQGEVSVFWTMCGLVLIGILKWVNLDVYAYMTIFSAGGILLYKLAVRRRVA